MMKRFCTSVLLAAMVTLALAGNAQMPTAAPPNHPAAMAACGPGAAMPMAGADQVKGVGRAPGERLCHAVALAQA